MKTVAIIQARMGSTRLPGKVLKDLAGKSVLARVVERIRRCRTLNEIFVATTDQPIDLQIVDECQRCSVPVFRGDRCDVLDRYFQAAKQSEADVVVRITSDCPLIDPEIVDKTVAQFLASHVDYASNALQRTYPRGLDTEAISFEALSKAWEEARKPYEREHVTPFIYEHPELFKLLAVKNASDHSFHRWTVDTPEDLQLVRTVYDRLDADGNFSWHDILQLFGREPELALINGSVVQKGLRE